ncbi:hypothetical protein A7K94_0218650 [Modestobacter sp. VKM Ac-2676]|nr:hypothetical protein A7K94_0218650 [Modestobacter sp. VKM Ac-2676]
MTWSIDEHSFRTPVRAVRPGSVEAAGTLLDLPPMTPVHGRRGPDQLEERVRGWLSTSPVSDPEGSWRRCARVFDRTGLWPLLAGWFDEHPYVDDEPVPPGGPVDAAGVLEEGWLGCTPVRADGTPLPHPPWPGLAPGRGAADERGVLLTSEHELPRLGGLLLVPATRPADAVAQLGWSGAVNWSLTGASISAVLRSWEDRFGAYLVGIGGATLDLVVLRPPVTARQCDLMAAEHFAFCPDNFFPQNGLDDQPISQGDYAARLRRATTWHFWWD